MNAGSVKAAVGLAVAVAIAAGMARGIHRPPGRPAAARPAALAPASSGLLDSPTAYRILALAVVAAVAVFAVRHYYKLQHRRLQLEIAQVDGWAQVRQAEFAEARKCPACKAWVSLVDIDQHQERSACGAYERWLADNEGEYGQPIRARAVPWIARQSATIPPDDSITAGGVDTMAGEIES